MSELPHPWKRIDVDGQPGCWVAPLGTPPPFLFESSVRGDLPATTVENLRRFWARNWGNPFARAIVVHFLSPAQLYVREGESVSFIEQLTLAGQLCNKPRPMTVKV